MTLNPAHQTLEARNTVRREENLRPGGVNDCPKVLDSSRRDQLAFTPINRKAMVLEDLNGSVQVKLGLDSRFG